jgi:GNAT superfamily N-acetyltransferase
VYDASGSLVGVGSWYLPSTLQVNESLIARLTRYWYTFKCWVHDKVLYLGREHPTKNRRLAAFFEHVIAPFTVRVKFTQQLTESFARMSYDELSNAEYPPAAMSYVEYVAIASSHQRKGLGYKLMKAMMADMPTEVEFKSKDGKYTSRGPGKHYLFASTSGRGLYEKLGFSIVDDAGVEDSNGNITCGATLMHFTSA